MRPAVVGEWSTAGSRLPPTHRVDAAHLVALAVRSIAHRHRKEGATGAIMRVSEALFEAMADLIRRRCPSSTDAAEVLAFEQDTRRVGCCETCAYTEVVVTIWYRTTAGTTSTYEYTGGLGELIRELTD